MIQRAALVSVPTYPAAALLLAWSCDRRGTARSRATTIVAGLTGAGAVAALAVLALPWLGRPLTSVRTVAAFDAWVTRPDRPLVVIIGREWQRYRHRVRSNVEVLDTRRIRSHLMFLVRLADPDTPRIEGQRAELARRPPTP